MAEWVLGSRTSRLNYHSREGRLKADNNLDLPVQVRTSKYLTHEAARELKHSSANLQMKYC